MSLLKSFATPSFRIEAALGLLIKREELLEIIKHEIFKLSIDHHSIPRVLGLSDKACESSRIEIEVNAKDNLLKGFDIFEAESREVIEGLQQGDEFFNYKFKNGGVSYGGVARWAEFNGRVAGFVRNLLFTSFRDTYVFPAERIALSSLDFFLTSDFENKFNLPIIDYVERSRSAKRGGEIGSRMQLDDDIESLKKKIISGNIEINRATNAIDFIVDNHVRIELKNASSLVKSLAGLFVLLTENVNSLRSLGRHLIVIDEPEMNAHPEAQRQIIELLAILMNMGNHVLITTHSPYLVDHLNNLIDAANLPADHQAEFAGENFALKSKEAILRAEDVGVYEFTTDGEIKELFDRQDRLIDTSTFGDVSNKIDATSFNIFEDLKAE